MINIHLKEKEVKKFLLIFYFVGLLGFIIPFTNSFFKVLIPYALITNFFVLFYFHKSKQIKKDLIVFLIIFLGGLIIEIIGVKTKIIFGDYTYANGLGFKLFNTPIIIGINWLFLVYTTSSVLEIFKINVFFKIIIASFLMLIYDIVLEQVAPKMDMWNWKNGIVTLQNYIAWFVFALFFNSLLKLFKIKTQNKLALTILICQFMFFLILFLFLDKL